jgi:hypothetical protein
MNKNYFNVGVCCGKGGKYTAHGKLSPDTRTFISITTYNHDYIYFTMTSTLIPIPENAEFWCNKLFYLHTPIVLTAEEFDTYWPLISTVYTKLSGYTSQQNGEVTVRRGVNLLHQRMG